MNPDPMFVPHSQPLALYATPLPCRTGSIDITVRDTFTSSLPAAISACRSWEVREIAICSCGCWSKFDGDIAS